MPPLACPACGTVDDLVGADGAAGVVVCGGCGHRWRRDLTPTCRRCGSTDLEAVPTATLEEAGRGNQRTPSGIRDVHRCWSCGARDATSSNPLPPERDWRDRRPVRLLRRRRDDDVGSSPADPAAFRVDSTFGRFEVGAVVGGRWRLARLLRRTSTGTLWRAVAEDGDRSVTFKLVHPHDRDAALHAGSARAVAGVAHPHLLRVLDVKQQAEHVLVVAEAVEGPTLADTGTVAPAVLVDLGAGVAGALAGLHAGGLAHLDVRPGAIVVPAGGRARLVDLGAGRVRARTGRDPRADERLAWLAPERIVAGDHSPAADVYSLGLTLWVAAGGQLEDLGAGSAAQAQRRLGDDDLPPVPVAEAGDAGARLTAAIAAATRRRPAERPSAAEVVELLQPAGDQPASSRRT